MAIGENDGYIIFFFINSRCPVCLSGKVLDSWVPIHQPFSRTFFVFFSRIL